MTIHPVTLSSLSQPSSDANAVKTGTVDSSKHGHGTFASTFEEVNGLKTIDKTVTYADGTQRSKEVQIAVNEDGSKTITKTNAHGKVTVINESKNLNPDGSISISKDVTNARGVTTTMTGTVTKSEGETDSTFRIVNADGQTETVTRSRIKDGNVVTRSATGTNWNGEDFTNQSTWTTFA